MTALERFENNTRLVYHVLYKYFPGKYCDEDCRQVALIGLWKACLNFKEEYGYVFSTFATQVIKNEVRMMMRRETSRGRGDVIITSLDAPISNDDDVDEENYISFIDITRDPDDMYAVSDILDALDRLKLNDRSKKILHLYSNGVGQSEIGKKLGLSQSYVSRILRDVKKQLVG